MPVPAYLFDAEEQSFIASNALFRDLIGYSSEELANLDWRDVVVPDEIQFGERAIESHAVPEPVEWRLKRKDGQVLKVVIASRRLNFVGDDDRVRDLFIALIVGDRNDRSPRPARIAFR